MNSVYPLKTISQLRPLLVGFRKANGLTQKDVSERLGVTQQTYARLEANPGSASIERLFRVLTLLGVDVVLSSGAEPFCPESSSVMEEPENQKYSPARREKW